MFWRYTLMLVISLFFASQTMAGKTCIDVPLIENLNLDKLIGKWYPQEMSNDEEVAKSCLQYTIENIIRKANTTVYVTRNSLNNTEQFKLVQNGNTSEFEAEWLGVTRTAWLVATDYTTYSIWYVCYPSDPSKATLSFATREAKRNEDVLKKAKDAVKNIDFSVLKPKLKSIPHDKCK